MIQSESSGGKNKEIAKYFLEEVVNNRKLSVLEELYSQEVLVHTPFVGDLRGTEAFKQFLSAFFIAFPDTRVQIIDQIAEEDKVVNRVIYTGTNDGSLLNMPATGKKIELNAIEIDRFGSDGRVCEHWGEANVMILMQQLGLATVPQRKNGAQ